MDYLYYLYITVSTPLFIDLDIYNFVTFFNIAAGNRAYHVHKKIFTSKLISRNIKLQLYNTLIHPTVSYTSETWMLMENMTN